MNTHPKLVRAIVLFAALGCLFAGGMARASDSDGDGEDDDLDRFPCDPTAVAAVYCPAQGEHAMTVFEDLWPSAGDLDFNDVVLSHNVIAMVNADGLVSSLRFTLNALALGASLHNGLALRLPIPSDAAASITRNLDDGVMIPLYPANDEDDLVVVISNDLRELFPPASFINTVATTSSLQGRPLNVNIRFDVPRALDLSDAPFDLFIFRSDDPTHQIHLPQYGGTATMNASLFGTQSDRSGATRRFVTASGLPFGFRIPEVVFWPREHVSIGEAYPSVVGFAASGGTENQDWYLFPNEDLLWVGGEGDTPPPDPAFVGPDHPPATDSCIAWTTVQFGTPAADNLYGTAVDASGNVIVVGYTHGTMPDNVRIGGKDAFIAKFSPSGDVVWIRQFGTTKADEARGIALDTEGNAYVVGHTSGALPGKSSAGGYDVFIAKYDTAGAQVWLQQFGTATHDHGLGIALASDKLYITGHTRGKTWRPSSDGQADVLVAQYDLAGTQLWVRQFGGGDADQGFAIAVDAQGRPTVAANSFGNYGGVPADGVWHGVKIALDTAGNVRWVQRHDARKYDRVNAITTLSNGDVVTGGYIFAEVGCTDVQYQRCYNVNRRRVCYTYTKKQCKWDWEPYITSTSSDGVTRWATKVSSIGTTDQIFGIARDASDNIYGVGSTSGGIASQPSFGAGDYFVLKLDDSGSLLWVKTDGTSANDSASSVAESNGGVFVGGFTEGSLDGNPNLGSSDAFITKFNSSGEKL
jgi:LruC domain-containing protein